MSDIEIHMPGIHRVAYPFVLEVFSEPSSDGLADKLSWRPGIRYQDAGDLRPEGLADGTGWQIIQEIARIKPGRFPERVFYTREWITPDGKRFGKGGLRVAVASKFRRLTSGYAIEYRMYDSARGDDPPATLPEPPR